MWLVFIKHVFHSFFSIDTLSHSSAYKGQPSLKKLYKCTLRHSS